MLWRHWRHLQSHRVFDHWGLAGMCGWKVLYQVDAPRHEIQECDHCRLEHQEHAEEKVLEFEEIIAEE